MNTNTFEIKEIEKILAKEIKDNQWILLTDEEKKILEPMSREERREWYSQNKFLRKSKWGFLYK